MGIDITQILGIYVKVDTAEARRNVDAARESFARLGVGVADVGKKLDGVKVASIGVNQALELGKKALGLFATAIDLSKMTGEMERLRASVPVDKLEKLRRETQGTVSEFELLQRAAKDLGVSATNGMNDTTLALQRVLTQWTNFFDGAKAAVGGLIRDAILWLDRLSDKLAGIDNVPKTRAQTVAYNANSAADTAYSQLYGAHLPGGIPGSGGGAWVDRESTPEWQALRDAYAKQFQARSNSGERDAMRGAFSGYLSGVGVGGATGLKKQPPQPMQDQGDFWGSLVRPTDHYLAQGVQGASNALDAWGQSPGGVTNTFSRFGGFVGSAIGGIGSGYERAAGGMRSSIGDEVARYEKFMEQIGDKTTLLGGAYSVMTDAMTASVEAAISGSESIGKAALKASAAALKAIALESTAKAAFSVAEGFFTGNPAKFAAAAQYGIAAALAGASSAALGAAAGGGGVNVGGPMTSPGGGIRDHRLDQSPSGSGGGITIYVGEGYVGKPVELATAIDEKLRAGRRAGVITTLPGAVTFKN